MKMTFAVFFGFLLFVSSPEVKAIACTENSICDDGRYCNGREYCAIPAGQTRGECRAAAANRLPCQRELGLNCNETTRSCEKIMCKNNVECFDENTCDAKRVCTTESGLDTFNSYYNVWGCKKVSDNPCPTGFSCRMDRGEPDGVQCIRPGCENPDKDGDGIRSVECGGDDCDDNDNRRYPGNVEVCDANNHDEDCNPETFGPKDSDQDGYYDALCCNVSYSGQSICGNDCHDGNNSIFPGVQMCSSTDPGRVFICGKGEYSCGEGNFCHGQPSGAGICIPQK